MKETKTRGIWILACFMLIIAMLMIFDTPDKPNTTNPTINDTITHVTYDSTETYNNIEDAIITDEPLIVVYPENIIPYSESQEGIFHIVSNDIIDSIPELFVASTVDYDNPSAVMKITLFGYKDKDIAFKHPYYIENSLAIGGFTKNITLSSQIDSAYYYQYTELIMIIRLKNEEITFIPQK